MEADENSSQDICRVCRCEGSGDRPLFHPCICTGSIKYIHQECLLQWLRYSKKEFCELCNHRFSFTPIYSPDMPKRLPLSIVLSGFLGTVAHAVRFWLHYTLVALAWIGIVPLTACRIYRTLFTGSVSSILSLPLNVFSTDNLIWDIVQGCAVVTLTLLAFIGLVWLREQILHGGGPEWLDVDDGTAQQPDEQNNNIPPLNNNHINNDNNNNNDQGAEDNLLAEPAAPEILEDDELEDDDEEDEVVLNPHGEVGGPGDDGQWNPMEWDRAADELTWERLLGLDGSLVFLEHVFWVVSLNTLFILVFAFCPYHIGQFTIMGFKLKPYINSSHFEGLMTTLCGYCIIAMSLAIFHGITRLLRLKKSSRILGLCYVVVKVVLLLVIEILAFPVICGWWIDVCSLSLFDATLKDRQENYHQSPETSIFFHWLIGMVYIFYFASFVILLREVLRPGVLWFLRNLNDPDFNPVQEMFHLSIPKHLRRFCASLVMFGTSILVMFYLPSRIIKNTFPNFLPYQTAELDSPMDELALQVLLVLVILPALHDQLNMREWLKNVIRAWCLGASFILDLRSYLFGDVPLILNDTIQGEVGPEDIQPLPVIEGQGQQIPQVPPAPPQAEGEGLGAAHQALIQRERPAGFQPYNRPRFFPAKIAGLLILMLFSWLVVSLISMLLPVWLGRQIFTLCFTEGARVCELYTSASGLLACLGLVKIVTLFSGWVRLGRNPLTIIKLQEWAMIGCKTTIAAILLFGVIPLMMGILFQFVLLNPVYISLNQTPVFFIWHDLWNGLMCTKVMITLTYLGPEWWLKSAMLHLCNDGIRGFKLTFLLKNFVIPVCTGLGLALSIPYILAHSFAPFLVVDELTLIMIQRRIYPFLLLFIISVVLIAIQLKQFKKLYEHIKNDKYLVGRRLVNYNHQQQLTSENAA